MEPDGKDLYEVTSAFLTARTLLHAQQLPPLALFEACIFDSYPSALYIVIKMQCKAVRRD